MKILKIIGVIILAIVVIGGIMASMQPAQAHIEQSIVINASPATVYQELNSFKSFAKWSPWAKMDPDAQYVFEGPESGVGSKMTWNGKKVGKGSQWIEESEENKRIRNGLSFEGMDGKAYAEFIITPQGAGTTLTWTYDGTNEGFRDKAIWLFVSGMLNDQYAQGLNDVKAYLETMPAQGDSTVMH